ncbi:hypothetical protein [Streptomyces sp. NBC_00385]|uniref:hypothetical protein n=1 Tax=Streptomyces sp. NBC_00385 TaxID=2975733 RepID=UPI002DDBEE04|nr:hypothetical protein [Streptomyces sp. NBC_00385]WRZ05097.1 hypothetical protein OG959_17920 [Streptomyces sp. NBC_00385]
MSEYVIRYSIIPPGLGPDDYEPADLEQREHLVDVPGEQPSVATIHSTVKALLPPGSGVAILSVRDPGEG